MPCHSLQTSPRRKRARSVALIAAAVLLGACGGGDGGGGGGITPPPAPPPPPPAEPAVAVPTVVAGASHSCALSSSGVVSCWGMNNVGQLGRGNSSAAGASPVAGSLRFKALSTNADATCGITLADKVYCWGAYRPGGQIQNQPVAVLPDLSFQRVTVGTRNVCALTALGDAWCWGENTSYQLGLGPSSTENSEGPGMVVGGQRFAAVNAGYFHTCALDQTGHAWCWGDNENGALGSSTNPRCGVGAHCSSVPLPVDGAPAFTSIEVGPTGTCAVGVDTRLVCWGKPLPGFYFPITSLTPLAVPAAAGVGIRQVGAGMNFMCVLTTEGAVLCMGGNEHGQLGRGGWDVNLHDDLVPVSGGRTYVSVSAGISHVCATQADGTAYCWGSNGQGQIGASAPQTCQRFTCASVPTRVTIWSDD